MFDTPNDYIPIEKAAPRLALTPVALRARCRRAARREGRTVVAHLGAGAPASASRNPFAGINGGYVFWGALALVGVVLLFVVAKLLPKPAP